MFRHQGKHRTYAHNLQIASLLSFVAGLVNVIGFLSIQKLTTNVTGHFAYLIEETLKLNGSLILVYFLYTFFFLLGAFTSDLLAEISYGKREYRRFLAPVSLEILILILTAYYGPGIIYDHPNIIAFSLLFAMGLQNAMVTIISNSIVRTTHLTGLFTDLGIELSQFLFYKDKTKRKKLTSSILLRFTIINFFFLGGITAGILYTHFEIHSLYLAPMILLAGLLLDNLKLKIALARRKMNRPKKDDQD